MPEWLRWLGSLFGKIFTRATTPPDVALYDHYTKEFDRLKGWYVEEIKGIRLELGRARREAEAERQAAKLQRKQYLDHIRKQTTKIGRLSDEVGRLQKRILVLEELRISGSFLVDREGIIRDANDAAGVLCGLSRQSLTGLRLIDIIPYRYREDHQKAFTALVQSGRPVRDDRLDVYLLRADGDEVPVQIQLSEWTSPEQGRMFGAIVKRR